MGHLPETTDNCLLIFLLQFTRLRCFLHTTTHVLRKRDIISVKTIYSIRVGQLDLTDYQLDILQSVVVIKLTKSVTIVSSPALKSLICILKAMH